MRSISVKNPEVPLLYSIPACFCSDCMIEISGQMLHSDRFRVDLRTGSHIPDNDVVFHLSIHPSSDVIIRNHKENGQWFDEEREGGCPIQFGDQFKMLIYVENDNIKVSINNFPFCEFTPRLPLSSAKFLSIGGGVIIHNVSIKNEN